MAIDLKNITPNKVSNNLDSYSTFIYGEPKTGKALADSTVIPTIDGEKHINEVKVGDFVFDRTGKPTEVLGVYPQGKQKVYEVHFEDGRVVKSNIDHLWTIVTKKGRYVTKTLGEIVEEGVKVTRNVHGNQKETHPFQVPINEALYFPAKELQYDPYILGTLIGDGSFKQRQLTISAGDTKQDILSYIAKETNSEVERNSESNYNYTFKLKEPVKVSNGHTHHYIQTEDIIPEYLINKLSIEKFLPKDIFEASYGQRLAMLQGLLDTDGHVASGSLSKITYSTSSEQLAKDVEKLSRTLGLRASTKNYNRSRENANTEYTVSIQTENYKKKDLFRFNISSLKKAEAMYDVKSTRNYKNIKIVDVVETKETENMTCLYVDNPEHLFLANDYVVTHNTTFVHNLYGDKVLHLMTEKRYKALDGAYVQYIASWSEYLQVMRQLKKDKELQEKFSVVSVDTVENLYDYLEKYVAGKYGEQSVGERDDLWGADWGDLKKMWKDGLLKIEQAGFTPVFVSHAIQNTVQIPKSGIIQADVDTLTKFSEKYDKKDGQTYIEFQRFEPDMKDKVMGPINKMVDNILFISTTVDTTGQERRVIHTRSSMQWLAGSTFAKIKDPIPLDAKEYTEAVRDAISEIPKEHQKTEEFADKDIVNEKPDFNSLMEEAKKIAFAMNKADKMNRVTAVVENVFGVGSKLTEATEEQSELLFEAVQQLEDEADKLGVEV